MEKYHRHTYLWTGFDSLIQSRALRFWMFAYKPMNGLFQPSVCQSRKLLPGTEPAPSAACPHSAACEARLVRSLLGDDNRQSNLKHTKQLRGRHTFAFLAQCQIVTHFLFFFQFSSHNSGANGTTGGSIWGPAPKAEDRLLARGSLEEYLNEPRP